MAVLIAATQVFQFLVFQDTSCSQHNMCRYMVFWWGGVVYFKVTNMLLAAVD